MIGLYRTDPNLIEAIAPDQAHARTMRAMFGPAWRSRKLTAAEAEHPWVLAEVQEMEDAGVWPS